MFPTVSLLALAVRTAFHLSYYSTDTFLLQQAMLALKKRCQRGFLTQYYDTVCRPKVTIRWFQQSDVIPWTAWFTFYDKYVSFPIDSDSIGSLQFFSHRNIHVEITRSLNSDKTHGIAQMCKMKHPFIRALLDQTKLQSSLVSCLGSSQAVGILYRF